MHQQSPWNGPRSSPAKSSLRLTSRFAQLGNSEHQPGQLVVGDSPSTNQSILNWKVPGTTRRGRLLQEGGDSSPDEGLSVDEFYFSTEEVHVVEPINKPNPRPKKNAIVADFTPDWRETSGKLSNKISQASSTEEVSSESQPSRGPISSTKPRVRRSSFTTRELQAMEPQAVSSGWASFDADADSTEAVSPPASVKKVWNAANVGESSPPSRKEMITPSGWSPERLSSPKKHWDIDSPGKRTGQLKRLSATRMALAYPAIDSGDDEMPSKSSPIKPLNPPKNFTATNRQTPQRRVLKISASDLGLTSRDALDPDIVRGAIRRLKSDSGEALFKASKKKSEDPLTPNRTPRRRGARSQSAPGIVSRLHLSSLDGCDANEKQGAPHTPQTVRHGLKQHGLRRSESLTEIALQAPTQLGDDISSTAAVLVAADQIRADRRQRPTHKGHLRPRSLSRGSDGRQISSKSTVPLLGRRQCRVSQAEALSLDRAIHSLQMLDTSHSGSTGIVRSCSDSVASFENDEKDGMELTTLRRSRSDSQTMAKGNVQNKNDSVRSRRTVSRDKNDRQRSLTSSTEIQDAFAANHVFASSQPFVPARGIKRADSGLTYQMIDQVGISSEQLAGLRELGLTITKV